MPIRLSTLFFHTLREDPVDAEVTSHKLMHRASYIRRAAPGIYTWLPLGLLVLNKVEKAIREEMVEAGAQEVHFPALLPREPYEATNRWHEYGDNLLRLQDRKNADYLLAPTHEEVFTLLVKDLYSSYKELPITLFQIQNKYRDEARPRAGLIRSREFIMKDAYSFDIDESGLDASYQAQRAAYVRIFDRLGLPVVIVEAVSGAMGGSQSEEFLYPTPIGEDTFVRSPAGYAANAEAVVTKVPESQDWENLDIPAAEILHTPESETIEALVKTANAVAPHPDREWQQSDTLKCVVLALDHPDGTKELVVVAVPGDREVDLKRVESVFTPAEVRSATAEELAETPAIVKGYVGPGHDINVPFLGQHGFANMRFFVDPRIVPGSIWITGANEPEKHVFNTVAGRDFQWDGVIEAAEVKAGDPAADGSGPLEIARGIEVGHVFKLGTKYAESLGLKVLNEDGKQVTVTMGSYGVGVSRVVAAVAEEYADEKGLVWPLEIAPAHVHIVATGKGDDVFEAAERLSADLEEQGVEVLFDDRRKVSPGVKFSDAELLGVPLIVVVGRGLANGVVELKERATGEASEVPLSEAPSRIQSALEQLSGSRQGQ